MVVSVPFFAMRMLASADGIYYNKASYKEGATRVMRLRRTGILLAVLLAAVLAVQVSLAEPL